MITINQNIAAMFQADLPPGKVGIILNRTTESHFPKSSIFENKSGDESFSFGKVFEFNVNA